MEKIKSKNSNRFKRFEEQKAQNRRLWNLDPISQNLLYMLTRLKKPGRVLEIGTSNGFSSFMMSLADPYIQIETIEVDLSRYEMAKENLSDLPNIIIHHCKAEELISTLKPGFDMVFIDANKPAYIDYLTLIIPLLNHEALIIADNITSHPETTIRYRDFVLHDDRFTTMLLPLEAGLLISIYNL